MEINTYIRQVESAIEGVETGSLTPQTQFRQLEQWDSLAALDLIVMASAEYSVEITAGDLQACNTVQDLFNVIHTKIAPSDS